MTDQIQLEDIPDEAAVEIEALVRCAGLTRPGPVRSEVVLPAGEAGVVPGHLARRWGGKKLCKILEVTSPMGAAACEEKYHRAADKALVTAAEAERARRARQREAEAEQPEPPAQPKKPTTKPKQPAKGSAIAKE